MVYLGKFNQRPSKRNWFKHDIYFHDNNRFVGGSFAPNVIRNDKDNDGNYLDPVSYEPIRDGDDVVCLGDENSYYCYLLGTIKSMIEKGNLTNPMTRGIIDMNMVKAILRSEFPELQNSTDATMTRIVDIIKLNGGRRSMANIIRETLGGYVVPFSISGRNLYFDHNFNEDPRIILNGNDSRVSGIVSINFGTNFNQPIDNVVWPPNLKTLKFGKKFNQRIDGVQFPRSLEMISFGKDFNQPIENVRWTSDLKKLVFGDNFNQPIENVIFPDTLEDISFGKDFNQPIENVQWPNSLQVLFFLGSFNQPIENVRWTSNLETLVLSDEFNQSIKNVRWPSNLKYLVFGDQFNQPIKGARFPDDLTTIRFGEEFDQPIHDVKFNKNLNTITVSQNYRHPMRVDSSDIRVEYIN